MGRSPPLRVYRLQLYAQLALAFTSPPSHKDLGLPQTITRRLIMQKARGHSEELPHLVGNWFQDLLAPLAGVLFTFPSRYLFTIGRQLVFSLIRWSGQIHAEFHAHRITRDTPRPASDFVYPAVTVYGRFFHIVLLFIRSATSGSHNPEETSFPGLGCSAFARHYLRNHVVFFSSAY